MDNKDDYVRDPDKQISERLIVNNPLYSFSSENPDNRHERRRRRRNNSFVDENAHIQYHYETQQSSDKSIDSENDLQIAMKESLKNMKEKEDEQLKILEQKHIEEENEFIKEQIKQIEEQEILEKQRKEDEQKIEKMEQLQKRYGIIMSIYRRYSSSTEEYKFYVVLNEWIQQQEPKIKLNEKQIQWLQERKNQKLRSMLEEDNCI